MDEEIKINVGEIKKGISKTIEFFKQKKVINILLIVLFLFLLIGSTWIRLQNLPLLKDSTTGEYLPLALDPFYFLRVAETIIEQGGLPDVDAMRYPSASVGFTNEILPQAVIFLYKISSVFDKEITLRFVDVISPVIFFALGLIVFFFLVYVLTKSKATALISSIFLAIIPTYLYRTLAGFADHESIGMFAFFLTLLCYGLALKFLKKLGRLDSKKKALIKTIIWGLIVGFVSAFTIAAWGGIANFIFMIIPLSFGIFWLIKTQNPEDLDKKLLSKFLIFYIVWSLSSVLFGSMYGFGLFSVFSRVFLNSHSLINGVILLFLIVDFTIIKFRNKFPFVRRGEVKKFRVLYSATITFILGIILLSLLGINVFSFAPQIIEKLLHPFGTGRTGLTVAENKQPFLNDWIAQIGKWFFWLFYLGMVFVGISISKGINKKKNKFLFSLLWIVMISGILFSRISSSSLFDGTNFISQLVYFGALILFFIYIIWLYFNDKIRIGGELILIASWLFFTLIAGRGAVRLFFAITPFVCFMAGYSAVKLFHYTRKNKEELLKLILFVALILTIIILITSFLGFVNSTNQQAKYTGPSANLQWQRAMAWVRENTQSESIFVHWWDYGYWVEYLGERPSVTDGGHSVKYWDHLIGRYLLTTPKPETALSFMKSHDVLYLLIDPTDLGKYGAYGKIGSDKEGYDRYSYSPIMLLDDKQTQEKQNSTLRVYQGGAPVDEDIIYNSSGGQIFLPYNQAVIAAIVLEISKSENEISFQQPSGVFIYNNQQIYVPLRYIYFNEEIFDFGGGLEAIAFVFPRIVQMGQQNTQIDNFGSIIYLSPKVSRGLFAQLYLMDDPFEKYPTIELVHGEQEEIVQILNSQGAGIDDFVYFSGFRGPIKIWKVDYPENILAREEFLRREGEYAEFDDLEFIK